MLIEDYPAIMALANIFTPDREYSPVGYNSDWPIDKWDVEYNLTRYLARQLPDNPFVTPSRIAPEISGLWRAVDARTHPLAKIFSVKRLRGAETSR